MNQEEMMKQIVAEVMKAMDGTAPASSTCTASGISAANYPLGEKMADKVSSPTGKKLADMTMEQIINGQLTAEDMRIAPDTLEMQAQVAESVGRDAFARNLRRAAELIAVPDERLLEIYNALRPYRSSKQELIAIADELANKYNCAASSKLVREAADIYDKRGRLKRD